VSSEAYDDDVVFRLADNGPVLAGVRLLPALSVDAPVEFTHADDVWTLRLKRPPVWRMEYRFQLRHQDGGVEEICDPDNPSRAPGAFGDKSVVEFPDYRRPGWLDQEPVAGSFIDVTPQVRVWSPGPVDEPLPLLIAHDGPEYDRLANLTWYSGTHVRHRVALLQPGNRDEEYSGNPVYAHAFARTIVPAIRAHVSMSGPLVGMGASLGGLAMLHVQRRFPALFGGLFLQSASFLDRWIDAHETRFSRFGRVVRFVEYTMRSRSRPIPVTMTCGLAEENLGNNRQMARVLREQEYPVTLVENPDAHNYVGWRDAWEPALTDLLREVWRADAT
jgi:enterochelin esterase-like enzyme